MMEELSQKELGRRLQEVRKHIGLKQVDVAEKVGCGSLTISRLERGENIGSSVLSKMLVIYSDYISLNTLFAKDFPENVDEVFKENRIDIPVSFVVDQIEKIAKLKKDMDAAFDYEQNNLLPRLQETIRLL